MALTTRKPALERYIRDENAPPEDQPAVYTAIRRDTKLISEAQTLFEQLAARPSPLETPAHTLFGTEGVKQSHTDNPQETAPPEKIWALVAVVATGISQEMQQERAAMASEPSKATGKRKRAAVAKNGGKGAESEEDSEQTGKTNGSKQNTYDRDEKGTRNDEAAGDKINTTTTWHLVELLAAANVSLSVFLKYLTSLFDRLLLEPELLEVATQVKEEFTIASVLFMKYRFLWKKVVPPVNAGQKELTQPQHHSTQQTTTTAIEDEVEREKEPENPQHQKNLNTLLPRMMMKVRQELLYECGWILFLVAKRRLTVQYAGLGQLYYLLLAVLWVMLKNVEMPSVEAEVAAALSALGSTKLSDSAHGEAKRNGNTDILEILCSNPKVDQNEVTRASGHLMKVLQHMQESGLLKVATSNGSGSSSTGPPDSLITAIFSPDVLEVNFTRLSEYYREEYVDGCGKLDERFYLDTNVHSVIMGPTSTPQQPLQQRPSVIGSAANSPFNLSMKARGRTDRLIAPNPMTSPLRVRMTPRRRESGSSVSSVMMDQNSAPPSPFTGQAWQWNGSSPPPSMSLSGSRPINTPKTRAFVLNGGNHQSSPQVAQTPVTAAVETSNWVRDTLTDSKLFLSPQLKAFFSECTNDPTESIAQHLSQLSHRLMMARRRQATASATLVDRDEPMGRLENMPQDVSNDHSEVDGSLKKTKTLAIALFYTVLEALLISERNRLHVSNFSTLLNNETFISSLFACSLEVVLKAHSLITLSFPFLLDNIGVNAFDFGKVIESFVKHVPSLPNALKRHMRDLEQTILDSLAWRSDSGLYILLSGESKPPAPTTTGILAVENENSSGNSGGNQQSQPGSTRNSVLQLFFRKVLSLAASRIFRLGNILELDAKYLNQVWTAIKECLSSQHHLLKDRHLDVIILCSIYGVCKVNHVKPDVSFKRVNECYKKMHLLQSAHGVSKSSSHDVIRNVKLDENTFGDIIKFYNRHYIPTMKVFLLQFQLQDTQMAAADAAVAKATGSHGTESLALPGFTPRREGSVVAASTSDTEIVAEAAADAVEKVMQSYGQRSSTPQRTPRRPTSSRTGASPQPFGSPLSSLQLFTTAEVQSLPVSVHHTSPKRVLASNVYMSPLQQARLHHRTHLTPRSHALYAFGESPSRDLALINRAVNTNTTRARVPPPLYPLTNPNVNQDDDDDDDDTSESTSTSASTTPTTAAANKKRRTG